MNIKKLEYVCLLMILCFSPAHAYRGRKGKTNSTKVMSLTQKATRVQKKIETQPFSFMAHLKQKFMGTSDRLRPSRSQRAHIAQRQAELKKSQKI